jgi:O-antigen ligase
MTLLTSFSIALASIVFFLTVPSFSARFKEVSINNTKLPDKKSEDSFNLRTGIFKCGTGIVKENWLLGIGPGNISAELNACYDSIAPDVYKDKNFNTHNQFIDYWAGLGVLGPLLLIALLGICAFSFWQTKNWIGLCTVLLFTGAMQTENLLVRQNGIVAFCYFIGIHIFALANSSEPNRGPKAEH